MDDELEVIRHQMEETRSSLAEKLEALEIQFRDTVETATSTVEKTVETVQETVESVKDTFDISRHVQRYPWLALGSAVAVGYLAGYLLGPSPRPISAGGSLEPSPAPVPASDRFPLGGRFSNGWNGNGAPKDGAEQPAPAREEKSPLQEGLKLLQGLAVGALMGALREAIARVLPEEYVPDTANVVDDWTTQLGGKPLPRLQRQNS